MSETQTIGLPAYAGIIKPYLWLLIHPTGRPGHRGGRSLHGFHLVTAGDFMDMTDGAQIILI
jgi:hypothetical protein